MQWCDLKQTSVGLKCQSAIRLIRGDRSTSAKPQLVITLIWINYVKCHLKALMYIFVRSGYASGCCNRNIKFGDLGCVWVWDRFSIRVCVRVSGNSFG